jgi:murein L,D-transpeptidase YcbB/YkuD
VFAAGLAAGCSGGEAPPPEVVVREHIDAQNEEDVEAILELYSPLHPDYRDLESELAQAFEQADARYELEELEVIEQGPEAARVRYVVNATRTDEKAAQVRVEGEYELALDGDAWRITGSKRIGLTYHHFPDGAGAEASAADPEHAASPPPDEAAVDSPPGP